MHGLLFPLLLLIPQSAALSDGLKTIDQGTLRDHENVLASDAFEGRAAGFPGNERAVGYLVKEVKSYGLAPAGAGNGYVQPFTFGRGEGRKAKNVIALWEGSDAALKDEFIVIGAHLDHVGKKGQRVGGQGGGAKEDDEIWNGADDNASGTSVLLVVARAFARSGIRPRRSVLFCWWNAEEAGLWGSRRWVESPTRPLHKVIYCLNLDMIGRNPQRPLDLEGVKNSEGGELELILTASFDAEGLKYTTYEHKNEAMFRSDGASFLRKGIPASMIFSYWHADYHKVGDHPEKIAYPRLAKIARASFRILNGIGNLDASLRLNLDLPLRSGRGLGIRGEPLSGEALAALKLGARDGAALVTRVAEGSVLAIAGLRMGDVITGFDGVPLPAARPLVGIWIRAQRPPKEKAVEVRRDGKKVVLKAVWPK